jgi:hypothetical protein
MTTKNDKKSLRTKVARVVKSILACASALLMAFMVSGCPGNSNTSPFPPPTPGIPSVTAVTPVDGAVDVLLGVAVNATFSEDVTEATIALTTGTPAVTVLGTATYTATTAEFVPASLLTPGTQYTATVAGAKSASGGVMLAPFVWSFTTTAPAPIGSPSVIAVTPADGAINALSSVAISATFSEDVTGSTIAVTTGTPAVAVPGAASYAAPTVVFVPTDPLALSTTYTVTVADATNAAGGVMLAPFVWSFTTVAPSTASSVNLGTAGNFVILSKSGVSTVPPSAVTGNVGVSPAAASYITGFSLSADASNVFATSPQVTGQVFAADYTPPTPSNLTTAVSDMETAFTDAAGRAPTATELGAGDISGLTLTPGVYKWGTGLLISTDVTLSGSATDIWIFQIAQDLTVASAARITLAGGAVAKNVFWQVSGAVNIGTTAHLEGVVLSQTSITFATGASINGRLLAQTAVVLDSNAVTQP